MLRFRHGSTTVRLAGDVPNPGLYNFSGVATPATVMKMAVPGARLAAVKTTGPGVVMESGTILTVTRKEGELFDFTLRRMGTRELMLLRIPLQPDLIPDADWILLPGIGPRLAQRIVEERHKNGAFGSLEGLLRVSGIGPGKIGQLRMYFN